MYMCVIKYFPISSISQNALNIDVDVDAEL